MASATALSYLYRRLGRTPPRPGPVRQAPPRMNVREKEYAGRLVSVVRLFADHVETIGRRFLGGRTDEARADAGLEDELRAAYRAIVEAAGLRNYLGRLAGQVIDAQDQYVKRVIRLPPKGLARPTHIEDFRQRNARLITNMPDEQIQNIASILREAQSTGQRWEEIAGSITERVGVTESRARLIARDQTNKFNGEMQRATQTAAGIDSYEWRTAGDMAVRGRPGGEYEDSKEDHWALRGKTFRWDDPPLIPGTNERAHPGQRIQCRCQAIPRVPFFEDV